METGNNVEFLLSVIDDELIKLQDAPNVETYKVFDFKTALLKLSSELKKNGYSDYNKEKVSKLVSVFNDLCNDVVETSFYSILSYDKSTHIATKSKISSKKNTVGDEETVTYEEIPEELRAYFSKQDFNDKTPKSTVEVCKFNFLTSNCKKDYSKFYPAVQHNFDGTFENGDDIANYINIMDNLLCHKDRFEEYFNIDINYLFEHHISFEQYVYQLKNERSIMNRPIQTNSNDNFENNKKFSQKVTTDAMLSILKLAGVSENTHDKTKIAKLISAITGFSHNTIRQRITNPDNLTATHHGTEVNAINHLLKELNMNISLKTDNR